MGEKLGAEMAPACHDGLTETQPDPLGAWRDEVRGREYAKALADGRVLMWRPIATRPEGRPVIVGAMINGQWLMMLSEAPWPPSLLHYAPTHWREDTLGTPYVVPASGREAPYCVPSSHRLP